MEDIRTAFGFHPIPPPPDFLPSTALRVEWPWLRALPAILRFLGWTIDDVVGDPRAARAVRQLWKAYRLAERHREEFAARLDLEERARWRLEGLPVPCPRCASRDPCSCRLDRFLGRWPRPPLLAGPCP